MTPVCGWEEKMAIANGARAATDEETIRQLIGQSCVSVEKVVADCDDNGIDFVARLRRGAPINVDLKARDSGCRKWWERRSRRTGNPVEIDIALETWSVTPNQRTGWPGKPGWTLDESKLTDYTLHVFDPSDTEEVFLLPFQLLRMAFRRRCNEWKRELGEYVQESPGWMSSCVFVPVTVILDSIRQEMRPLETATG